MTVLDASAVLAYLKGEAGSDVVADRLRGSVIGAANLAEVLAKLEAGAERSLTEALLDAQGVAVEQVGREDARVAARLRDAHPHLSLGDRLCLALAERVGGPVLTADRQWGSSDTIVQIR